jgi:hypothetical protein
MRCIIYDLAFTTRHIPSFFQPLPISYISRIIEFDDPVLSASFHPRTSKLILANLMTRGLTLVDLRKPTAKQRWHLRDVTAEEDANGVEREDAVDSTGEDVQMEAGPSTSTDGKSK